LKALAWHAGLGDGRLHATARTPAYHREAIRALSRLREHAETVGGRLFVENAPQEFKNEFDSEGDLESAAELMKRVKQELDPAGRLPAGRFFASNGSAV
jgi:FAD/FMN-containing dehydrogenase